MQVQPTTYTHYANSVTEVKKTESAFKDTFATAMSDMDTVEISKAAKILAKMPETTEPFTENEVTEEAQVIKPEPWKSERSAEYYKVYRVHVNLFGYGKDYNDALAHIKTLESDSFANVHAEYQLLYAKILREDSRAGKDHMATLIGREIAASMQQIEQQYTDYLKSMGYSDGEVANYQQALRSMPIDESEMTEELVMALYFTEGEYQSLETYYESHDVAKAIKSNDMDYIKEIYNKIAGISDLDPDAKMRLCDKLDREYREHIDAMVHDGNDIGVNHRYQVSLDLYGANYKESLKLVENVLDKSEVHQFLVARAYYDDSLSDEERATIMEQHATEYVRLQKEEKGRDVPNVTYHALKTNGIAVTNLYMTLLDSSYNDALATLKRPQVNYDFSLEYQLLYQKLFNDKSLTEEERTMYKQQIEKQYMDRLTLCEYSDEEKDDCLKTLRSMATEVNEYTELVDALLNKDYEKAIRLESQRAEASIPLNNEMNLLDASYDDAMEQLKGEYENADDVKSVDIHKQFKLMCHKLFRDNSLSEAERELLQVKIEEEYKNYLTAINPIDSEDPEYSEKQKQLEKYVDEQLFNLRKMASGRNNYTRVIDAILNKDYLLMDKLYAHNRLDSTDIVPIDEPL